MLRKLTVIAGRPILYHSERLMNAMYLSYRALCGKSGAGGLAGTAGGGES